MNKFRKLHTFWVVTKPTPASVLADICWETTAVGLVLSGRGGLDPDSIVGSFDSSEEAEHEANAELEKMADYVRDCERIDRAGGAP